MCGTIADSHGRKVSWGTHVRELTYVVELRLTVVVPRYRATLTSTYLFNDKELLIK